jgi:hypothetical protein
VVKISCQAESWICLIDFGRRYRHRGFKNFYFAPLALGHRGADDQRDRGRVRRLPEGGAGGARRGGLQPFSHRQQGHRTVNIHQQESVNGGETNPLPDSCLFWLLRQKERTVLLLFTFGRFSFLLLKIQVFMQGKESSRGKSFNTYRNEIFCQSLDFIFFPTYHC